MPYGMPSRAEWEYGGYVEEQVIVHNPHPPLPELEVVPRRDEQPTASWAHRVPICVALVMAIALVALALVSVGDDFAPETHPRKLGTQPPAKQCSSLMCAFPFNLMAPDGVEDGKTIKWPFYDHHTHPSPNVQDDPKGLPGGSSTLTNLLATRANADSFSKLDSAVSGTKRAAEQQLDLSLPPAPMEMTMAPMTDEQVKKIDAAVEANAPTPPPTEEPSPAPPPTPLPAVAAAVAAMGAAEESSALKPGDPPPKASSAQGPTAVAGQGVALPAIGAMGQNVAPIPPGHVDWWGNPNKLPAADTTVPPDIPRTPPIDLFYTWYN